MRSVAPTFDARTVEAVGRSIWSTRALPPPDGPQGTAGGSLVRLLSGPFPSGPLDLAAALRLVRLDAEERQVLLSGGRAAGQLRLPLAAAPAPPPGRDDAAAQLGVWLGGGHLSGPVPAERELRRPLLERLAAGEILVARSIPVRVCTQCRRPRNPEAVVHQSEIGSAYLVRFALRGSDPPTSLLAWVDAPWKLLACTALVVHPTLTYATVRVRRQGHEERILLLRSAVDRLRLDLPDVEVEPLEELPGSSLVGRAYGHPLALENPALAELPAPAGTILASPEVEDYGTGILPLAPAHGALAAAVGDRAQMPGWPVVGTDGVLTRTIPNKYSGLPLEDAESFLLRDLLENEAVFASHPVRKGVPRCGNCGTPLLWVPARLWFLDPSKLPPDRLDVYRHAAPDLPVPSADAPTRWPVTEFETGEQESSYALTECGSCERLAPGSAAGPCHCGGTRRVVHRRLIAPFEEALAAWAAAEPFPDGTPVRLVVPERRR